LSSFDGKVAIVTGAGQGIGEATARALAKEGARVAVCEIHTESGTAIAKEIGGAFFSVDVANVESLDATVAQIEREMGPVAFLVNNAGICMTEAMTAITLEGMQRTFSVNVFGAFFLMRACAERMKTRGGGAIVNLASISGFLPKLEQATYGASKAALVSLTRSMALAYGPERVRINAVAPGVAKTPMVQLNAERRAKIRGVTPAETQAPMIAATPLGRFAETEEVASAILFLLSDQASYITGQTLDVCGGFLMR
jgi:NAD(P)-dependent dehydrogenase (short-subunit alcohol dehydrogenase family)